jgi:hypothetical protein
MRSPRSVPKLNEEGEGEEGNERRYPQRAVEKQHGEDDDRAEDEKGEVQQPDDSDASDDQPQYEPEGPSDHARQAAQVLGDDFTSRRCQGTSVSH